MVKPAGPFPPSAEFPELLCASENDPLLPPIKRYPHGTVTEALQPADPVACAKRYFAKVSFAFMRR